MRRSRTMQQRDRRREMQICLAVLTLLGGVVAAALAWKSLAQPKTPPLSLAQVAAQLRAEMRTGPILFVPLAGNVCSRRLIDNETWRIRDGGHVVCDEAVSWNATVPLSTYSVTRRVDALRTVFSPRQ